MDFILQPRVRPEHLGMIPMFLLPNDPRSAREQFDERYAHGGGWQPFKGFTMTEAGLEYLGDPPVKLLAEGRFRDEIIRIYEYAWVAVVQPDGSYEISRMD